MGISPVGTAHTVQIRQAVNAANVQSANVKDADGDYDGTKPGQVDAKDVAVGRIDMKL